MGIYREHLTTLDDEVVRDSWDVFEQPAWRRALSVSVEAVTLRTGRLERALDPLARRLHRRHCANDCRTAPVSRIKPEWTTPEGMERRATMKEISTPPTHPEMWDTEVETFCGRMSLGARVDLWTYDLTHRARRPIGTVTGEARPRATA